MQPLRVRAGARRDSGRRGDALKAATPPKPTLPTVDMHASAAAASIALSRILPDPTPATRPPPLLAR